MPSTELIRSAQAGDQAAFHQLYKEEVGRVYAVCLRMTGDRHEAEERTQDAFVRAWERLQGFRGESAFSTWLYRLTVNTVLEARRSSSRRYRRVGGESAAGEMSQAPDPAARPTGLSGDLDRAVAALPEGARTVFVLHDVEGYQHEEIAAMTGIAPGTSKAQLHRARQLLRQALGR